MNLVVRLKYKDEVKKLLDQGADIILLDVCDFTSMALLPLNKEDLLDVINIVKSYRKKVYVWMNIIIHEYHLESLKSWLKVLSSTEIDGIVINDFTIYAVAREFHLDHLVIYQPGTMNTHSYDLTYLNHRIKGLTLSKEITFDEIQQILQTPHDLEISLLGHGFVDMFFSKRKLISLYKDYRALGELDVVNETNYVIEEKTREGIFYPIHEDLFGTHIYRDSKLESFEEIDILKNQINDFFIERMFLDDNEYYASIKAYKDPASRQGFRDKYGANYYKGFYDKPTEKTKGEKHEN